MRERINRLSRGIIENGIPELEIKPQAVEAEVPSGQVIRGELLVNSGNDLHIKGLVYSDNERVRVLNNAFGGLRNRISYEVNSEHTEQGDEIRGSFYLVTNGGERKVPYSLRVQSRQAQEGVEKLLTARDFAALAKRDLERALRLFEYQDFTEAPFMQDAGVRTIYEGLRGRTGRRNLLEEFLVALRVKEPVKLLADTKKRLFEAGEKGGSDAVSLTVDGWGYVSVNVTADASFIRLAKTELTDQDFVNGHCMAAYEILPEKLHAGKNFGRIRICTLRQEFSVEVEADCLAKKHSGQENGAVHVPGKNLYPYLCLRLDYEAEGAQPVLLINQMLAEAEKLLSAYPHEVRLKLLKAELLLLSGGQEESAKALLREAREAVLVKRQNQVEFYCYYQYLSLLAEPSAPQKESLIRYIRKLIWEEGNNSLWLLLLLGKLDETLLQNPLEFYHSLENCFRQGNSSPFLYAAACRLWKENPGLFAHLGDFELQLLYQGTRRGMISKELALKAAGFLISERHYRKLTERLAGKLYEIYPEMELLEAVCSILIKGEKKGPEAFAWYEKALKAKINLTRLYEYFLYSLPGDYGCLLPKEVLLYFSYDKDLDSHSRAVLYSNILRYMNPSSKLYGAYTRDMEQFAMEQLFQYRIDSQLAVLYEHMIYKDMIDERIARVLPGILKSCRIQCEDARMKYVIVRCEELDQEKAYLLENGCAYVPVFSKNIVLLFQDAYGSRYLDVKHRRIPVMDKPELLEQCSAIYSEHPMLKLGACLQVLEQGVKDAKDAALLEETMARMNLNPVFERRMITAVTDYCCKEAMEEKDSKAASSCTWLLQADKEHMGEHQRQKVCEVLIHRNYIQEAYDMIQLYGSAEISGEALMKLCGRMILMQLFDQDDLLLLLAYRSFKAGRYDSVLMDYLCEHFNGTVSQMYEVLIQGVKERVETYDMEERLLCQMLFTGCCEQIDSVFELYVSRKKTSESVVKAYFTQKCIQYFLEEKEVDGRVFDYLKRSVKAAGDVKRLPTIYLLALTRFFADCERLEEEDKGLCRKMTAVLLEENLVFSWTKKLARHIPIPEDILDKAMVEYRGRKNGEPELFVRILPQEKEFHREELRRVYQGIFVKQKVLFQGETMEYRIYDAPEGERTLVKEGKRACDDRPAGNENSRFACLNRMGTALEERDEKELAQAMEDYLKRSAALGILFPLQ